MKVKNAINILENMIDILKHYENQTLEDMLKDIKKKLAADVPVTPMKKIEEAGPPHDEVVAKLQELPKEEQIRFLSKYKKNEIIKIGTSINIKLQPKDKKDILIQSIVNHFSFIRLNDQMGNRKK